MSHIHSVIDTDVHYKIDGITRTVVNIDETKRELVQGDHNSERFTFEIPRYVDGHDFLKCNVVQVHYENVDTYEKNVSKDIYNVDDLHIKSDDDKTIVLSWLIHGNATKYVGSLNFVIRFSCVTDGQIDYAWNTTEFKGISILKGLYNSETVNEQHSDAIANLVERVINLEGKAPDSAVGDLTWSDVGSEIQSDMILYNGTANFNDAGYHTITSPLSGLPVPSSVVPGSTYKVTITPYNSSSYTPITGLTVREYSFTPPDATKEKNYFFIGNAHIANADRFANTGEQFVIIVDPDNKPNENGAYGWIYTNSVFFQKYPTTFRLSGKREIVTQLPKKYLPNDVGAISSWNDLTDKPFGDVEKEGYILPEMTLEVNTEAGAFIITHELAALPVVGETYKVAWNNVEYNCVAQKYENGAEHYVTLGDIGAMSGEEGTGEPFVIILLDAEVALNVPIEGMCGMAVPFDGSATATFSVFGLIQKTEKIDAKYLPNNIKPAFIVEYARVDGAEILVNGITFADIHTQANAGRLIYIRAQGDSGCISGVLTTLTHFNATFIEVTSVESGFNIRTIAVHDDSTVHTGYSYLIEGNTISTAKIEAMITAKINAIPNAAEVGF